MAAGIGAFLRGHRQRPPFPVGDEGAHMPKVI
jgi:hypothetical protein